MRDRSTTKRLRALLNTLHSLTVDGTLHWERQRDSDRHHARWSGNVLVIAPYQSSKRIRQWYLYIAPLDSNETTEIHSNDEALGSDLLGLVRAVLEEKPRGSSDVGASGQVF